MMSSAARTFRKTFGAAAVKMAINLQFFVAILWHSMERMQSALKIRLWLSSREIWYVSCDIHQIILSVYN